MQHIISSFFIKHGYLALFLGCIAEGESFAIICGAASSKGLLQYRWIVLIAIVGSTIGDTILYFLGRRYGKYVFYFLKKYKLKIKKARSLLHKYPIWFIIGVRFMYGLRIIGPAIIGASQLQLKYFMPLNILGSIIWSFVFISIGYIWGGIIK